MLLRITQTSSLHLTPPRPSTRNEASQTPVEGECPETQVLLNIQMNQRPSSR
jgi:hypothetical protein